MTARPFSRLEPISRPDDPARAIATFFAVISAVGILPGLFGLLCFGAGAVGALAEGRPAVFACLGMLAFIALGFTQLGFYLRRSQGNATRQARRWWLSTYFYNFVPLGISVAVLVQDPHIGAVAASAWFSVLCTLAIVAYGAEYRVGDAPLAIRRLR